MLDIIPRYSMLQFLATYLYNKHCILYIVHVRDAQCYVHNCCKPKDGYI